MFYPTKQQTGIELFQLVHGAAANFQRLALYFENSLLAPDLRLLSSAAATVTRMEKMGEKTVVESGTGVGIPWKGPALVDGEPWAAADSETIWLPAGARSVEAAPEALGLHLVRLNGELKAARIAGGTMEFSYQSSARAIAILDAAPRRMLIDGVEETPQFAGPMTILLPARAAYGDNGHPVS